MDAVNLISKIVDPWQWYEELMSPLFWLTHPQTKIYRHNLAIIYANRRQRVYYINGQELKEQQKAKRYFRDKKAIDHYLFVVHQFLNNLTSKQYVLDTHDSLPDQVDWALRSLNAFNELYNKTDGTSLEKLDNKLHSELTTLGELRLELRKALEKWYTKNFAKVVRLVAKTTHEFELSLYFYTYNELMALIKTHTKVDAKIIKQRKRGYCLIILNRNSHILLGDDFQYANAFFTTHDYKDFSNNQFTGRVASPGIIVGKVRLILHNLIDLSSKVKAFQKGEILVAESTRPGIILACQKAGAIVTDEGGMASHAAIIARELKNPCIVGTKIATRVLKTGDIIRVDANTGIVTILKRS